MGKKDKSRRSKDRGSYGDPGLGFSPYQQQKGMSYTPDKTAEARKVRKTARDEIDDALYEAEDYDIDFLDADEDDFDYEDDDEYNGDE